MCITFFLILFSFLCKYDFKICLDAKVKANGLHAGPLCLFFSSRMKVVGVQCGPTFYFLLLKRAKSSFELWTSL